MQHTILGYGEPISRKHGIIIQLTNQSSLVGFRPIHFNKWQYRVAMDFLHSHKGDYPKHALSHIQWLIHFDIECS